MKRKTQNTIGGGLTLLGLIFIIVFYLPVKFDRDPENWHPENWFNSAYYTQFVPLFIAITLLLTGIFVLGRFKQANLYLAVFGHTAFEEIAFSWIGWTTTPLPGYAIALFFPLSIACLWMGYFNVLQLKRLSVIEAIFGIVLSTACVLGLRSF